MASDFRSFKEIVILIVGALSFAIGSNNIARADIDLISIGGEPITLNGWMRTREYVWSYFRPGAIKNQTYDNSYNYQAGRSRLLNSRN
jgi:hypothetical protein